MQHIDPLKRQNLNEENLDDILNDAFVDLEDNEKLDALLDESFSELNDVNDEFTSLHLSNAFLKNQAFTALMKSKNFLIKTMNIGGDMFISMFKNNPQFLEQMNAAHIKNCKNPDCKHDIAAFVNDPDCKEKCIAYLENMSNENFDKLMTNSDQKLGMLAPIFTNPETLQTFCNHPNSSNLLMEAFVQPEFTNTVVEVFSDIEVNKAMHNTKNSAQDDTLEKISTTIFENHPEIKTKLDDINDDIKLNLAIKALLAATKINEQDSEHIKLLKAAGNKIAIAAQEAKNLSVEEKKKLFLYVSETIKLVEGNPKADLDLYSTYVTESVGMGSNTVSEIANYMMIVFGVVLFLASAALIVGVTAVTCGASIPFFATVIATLGAGTSVGIGAAGCTAGISFATFGGVFADSARERDIHLAMDDFSKVCRLN